ncbi:hypothetical protein H0H92_014755 [Tricholoma furcatifolium]|nr:hypothetical protein H0H92_014755 [Tricholoma furcatifolium]
MCIALWALDHQDYSLNRDELLKRPTLDAHFHNFEPETEGEGAGRTEGNILSGRDVLAGGTWFGVTHLSEPLEVEADKIVPHDSKFAGFNLLLFKPTASLPDGPLQFDSVLVTNHGSGGTIQPRLLSAKERICGCVSNAIDGGPTEWPKVRHAKQELDTVLQTLSPDVKEAELVDHLFNILDWRAPDPVMERSQLRNTVHVLPFPITLEGVTITGNNSYGTRLSTILLIKKNGEALFIERDMWRLEGGQVAKANPESQRIFRFQVKR